MNHRLKDKAATLSATSLQGDRDEGVKGQDEPRPVPNGWPKTPNWGVSEGIQLQDVLTHLETPRMPEHAHPLVPQHIQNQGAPTDPTSMCPKIQQNRSGDCGFKATHRYR